MSRTLFKCLCLSFVAFAVHSKPYSCTDNYTATNYINSLRVPTDCSATIPSYCPRSWKSGVPGNIATSKPLINAEFIICHEAFTSCGYVPINPKNGEILGKSGVTVGSGVDLGSKTRSYPGFNAVPSSLVDKLEPYFGLRKNFAACAAIERPLKLSTNDANNLTEAVMRHTAASVELRYDKDKGREAMEFLFLPRGIRTAIVSVWFQFGKPEAYPKFWGFVRENNWQKAIEELRDFYGNPAKQQRGDLKRRNDEADVIEAALLRCNRALDAVFLLHAPGSISADDFNKSLDFLGKVITAFPDEKLRGENRTRFGLSTFARYYRNVFSLSQYSSQSDYLTAIKRIRKSVQAGADLGLALGKLLPDQLAHQFQVRSEEHGTPLVLIIVTFEPAEDKIKIASQLVRDENIVVYSIGVGNNKIDELRLREIATSRSHASVLTSFSELETFAGTLSAALCNEPQPIHLKKIIHAETKKNQYQYYLYNVSRGEKLNLEIKLVDLEGETLVYVSRSNPHPYKYESDLRFDDSSRRNKVLVITPEAVNVSRKSTGYQDIVPVFVSVLARTGTARYTIEGTTCSPSKCSEGTNEGKVSTGAAGLSRRKSCSLFIFLALILLFSLNTVLWSL